jgi:hypothetical protein
LTRKSFPEEHIWWTGLFQSAYPRATCSCTYSQCTTVSITMPVCSQVEVEVKLRTAVSRSVRLGVWHPSGTRDQFFFRLENSFRELRICYFVAPSLTRGRVCNLLLLLILASSVPLGLSPAGLNAIFYCPNS